MDANAYIIALLEEIAFNTSVKVLERSDYLNRIKQAASSQRRPNSPTKATV